MRLVGKSGKQQIFCGIETQNGELGSTATILVKHSLFNIPTKPRVKIEQVERFYCVCIISAGNFVNCNCCISVMGSVLHSIMLLQYFSVSRLFLHRMCLTLYYTVFLQCIKVIFTQNVVIHCISSVFECIRAIFAQYVSYVVLHCIASVF